MGEKKKFLIKKEVEDISFSESFHFKTNTESYRMSCILGKYGGKVQEILESGLDGTGPQKVLLQEMRYYRSLERSLLAFLFVTDNPQFPQIMTIMERTERNSDEFGPQYHVLYTAYDGMNLDRKERIVASVYVADNPADNPCEIEEPEVIKEKFEEAQELLGDLNNFLNKS